MNEHKIGTLWACPCPCWKPEERVEFSKSNIWDKDSFYTDRLDRCSFWALKSKENNKLKWVKTKRHCEEDKSEEVIYTSLKDKK